MPHELNLTRRDWLKAAGALAAATALPSAALLAQDQSAPKIIADRKRVLRIAHLTDMHIQPELRGGEGLGACLKHVQSQPDKPDVIFTGGDTVFDSFEQEESRTRLLWDLWKNVCKNDCSLPIESCLGNHDIWGWNKAKSKTTGDEPNYGKKWAADVFGVPKLYRSFDKAGWHFVFLDSVFPNGDTYIGRLDDEQFAWLEGDLKAVGSTKPVLIISHIPILSVAALVNSKLSSDQKQWTVDGGIMHTDAKKLRALFNRVGNVKVCLSGHLHLLERVQFEGVTYLCNGAVSGAWWKGRHQHCDEGYALVDLYGDGTFENQYITYGWKANPA